LQSRPRSASDGEDTSKRSQVTIGGPWRWQVLWPVDGVDPLRFVAPKGHTLCGRVGKLPHDNAWRWFAAEQRRVGSAGAVGERCSSGRPENRSVVGRSKAWLLMIGRLYSKQSHYTRDECEADCVSSVMMVKLRDWLRLFTFCFFSHRYSYVLLLY